MRKIFITALLLASAGTAQAGTEPCNPAISNWVNAAPITCRFINKGNNEPLAEPPAVQNPTPPSVDSVPE